MKVINMLTTLKKIVYSLVREHITKPGERSTKWKTVRKHHLEANPCCAVCKSTTFLQVHHIKSFKLDPNLELDLENLITLCMSLNKCHLELGHGDDFHAINPFLLMEVEELTEKQPFDKDLLEVCKEEAKKYRRYTD